MDEQLSPHFTLAEMVRSQTALRKGIDNTPSEAHVANLRRLCIDFLEPIRSLIGVPMHVDSGYRSPELNATIGGSPRSAHMDGRAVDVVPINLPLRLSFRLIQSCPVPLDQLILECNAWIHIGIADLDGVPRREFLIASGGPGNWSYERVG